ncbi:MAG TPA: DUF402 domain-containing protein, partial [Anaerolineae bacterium]|nr:DUF402 domain-containing protein [Anaerolineae bacterium]
VDLGYTVFERGDRFVEYYYEGRWYNIFAVYRGKVGALKGWYCNISQPARFEGGEIFYVDMALDVWVGAEGEILVLDEDEFEALGVEGEVAEACWEAVAELKRLGTRGELPR